MQIMHISFVFLIVIDNFDSYRIFTIQKHRGGNYVETTEFFTQLKNVKIISNV